MKRAVAAILTLVVLLAIVRWRGGSAVATALRETPTECVQAMFESAASGEVNRYLDCFDESERARLSRDLGGDTPSAGEALRRSMADLKGWALLDPPADDVSASCRVTVEWVYATRVDRQQLELRQEGGSWRIVRVEQVQPTQPAIPYGTPIFGPLPEDGDTSR
jgi:hypothetical protein